MCDVVGLRTVLHISSLVSKKKRAPPHFALSHKDLPRSRARSSSFVHWLAALRPSEHLRSQPLFSDMFRVFPFVAACLKSLLDVNLAFSRSLQY